MIIDTTLNGRPCTAIYMTRAFEPVDNEADAELVKVRFMDEEGGVLFLVPQREEETPEPVAEEKKLTTELMLDKDQAQALKDRWQEQAKGLDQSSVPILASGLKPKTDDREYVQRYHGENPDERDEAGKFAPKGTGGADGADKKPSASSDGAAAEKPKGVIASYETGAPASSTYPHTISVEHHPETGSKKPYEIWNHYHSGRKRRTRSFKTEESANEAAREDVRVVQRALAKEREPQKLTSADRIRAQRWEVVRARAMQLLQRFDPDQPRDETGKWTSGGAGMGLGGGIADIGSGLGAGVAGPARGRNAPGADKRVSTSLPSAAAAKKEGVEAHKTARLTPSYASFKRALNTTKTVKGETTYPYREGIRTLMEQYGETGGGSGKTAYPAFLRLPENATPAQAAEAFVEHAKLNIMALYDAQDSNYRERSKLWYEGANKLANQWATEYKVSPQAVAGVIACMSPQRDWDQNVDLAKRMLDTVVRDRDVKFTGEDADKIRDVIQDFREVTQANMAKARKEGKQKTIDNCLDTLKTIDEVESEFEGKTLFEMPERLQPYVARFATVAKDDPARGYAIWNPEGTPSGKLMRNELTKAQIKAGITDPEQGTASRIGWGNFGQIGNAISILKDDSNENISKSVGERHKVRNFYNNIISPNYGTDATIDTHAIAASMMMPLGQSSPLVEQGLGARGPSNAETGLNGVYALHYEAYRRAAEEISERDQQLVLPREMQSITWEALRGLYSETEKDNAEIKAHANSIWSSYQQGTIALPAGVERTQANELKEAQRQILAKASPTASDPNRKGIRPPRWAQ